VIYKRRFLRTVLALALLWVAAAAAAPATSAQPAGADCTPGVTAAGTDSHVWCTNKSWRVNFYSEPELINVVGWIECRCYQRQGHSGQTTQYLKLIYEWTCPPRD
jgi:hypothetical protein